MCAWDSIRDKGGLNVPGKWLSCLVLSLGWGGKALGTRGWQVSSEAEKAQLCVFLHVIRQLCLVLTWDACFLALADKTWLIEEAGKV